MGMCQHFGGHFHIHLRRTRRVNNIFNRMHLIHFSGDAGADLDVRDPWRLVVESAAVLLRPGGGRRAGQAQEKVRQGREREGERQMSLSGKDANPIKLCTSLTVGVLAYPYMKSATLFPLPPCH